ncbi:MAG: tetratricopeptide repeat protein, partial [Nitrospiraceae bacterium]|nr:tetratricopeptide repeat protein [Nitrospiraceae bacterium]
MPKTIKKRPAKKAGAEETRVLSTLKETVSRRQKTILTASAAAVLFFALAAGVFFYFRNSAAKANEYNYEGYSLYYNLYTKEPLTPGERFQKALGYFQKAYSKKKSAYALYYIGASQYELGKYDDAIKTLTGLTKKYPSGEYTSLALYKMAMASFRLGKNGDALKYFDTLEKSKTGPF